MFGLTFFTGFPPTSGQQAPTGGEMGQLCKEKGGRGGGGIILLINKEQ